MDQTNLDIYGHPPLSWSRGEQALEAAVGRDITHFLGAYTIAGLVRWY